MSALTALTAPIVALPGGAEIYIILAVVLLLFGSRIPKVARSLGQGISQFKKGLNEAVDMSDDGDEAKKMPAGDEKPALDAEKSASKNDA